MGIDGVTAKNFIDIDLSLKKKRAFLYDLCSSCSCLYKIVALTVHPQEKVDFPFSLFFLIVTSFLVLIPTLL